MTPEKPLNETRPASAPATQPAEPKEDRLSALINASPLPKLLSDAENRITIVNPAFVRAFGYPPEEVRTLGEWWLRAVPDPEQRDVVVSAWHGLLGSAQRGPSSPQLEIRVRTRAGTIKTVLLSAAPLGGSELGGWLMLLHDITERKAAEDKLKASETLLRIAGRAARLGAWSLDIRDRSITWSDEACTIHGMPQGTVPTEEEMVGLYLPEYRGPFRDAIAECARSGAVVDIECEGLTAQGLPIWVRAIAHPERDQSGLVRRIHGAVQDITRKKERDLELARTHRALKMLSACNEAVVRAKDEDSMLQTICRIAVETGDYKIAQIRYVEDNALSSIPVRAEAGEKFPFRDKLPASWSEPSAEGHGPLGKLVRSGESVVIPDLAEVAALQPFAAEIRAARLGSTILLALTSSEKTFGALALAADEGVQVGPEETRLLKELAGSLAFGIASIRAHSERDQASAALRASLKEKDGLLKEVHHRIKNNLQVVTSLLRLEANRINHPETTTVLKGMQNRIQSMALLHEALYRADSFSKVDLGAYLRQLISYVSRSLVSGPSHIEFRLDLGSVEVAAAQAIPCGLIVNEIVTNAVKHAFPGGRSGSVWIDLHRRGEEACRLGIRDDGVGLPPDFAERQAKSLGMQVVSDLVRQLNGVLNIVPGPGSCFEITFTPTQNPVATITTETPRP